MAGIGVEVPVTEGYMGVGDYDAIHGAEIADQGDQFVLLAKEFPVIGFGVGTKEGEFNLCEGPDPLIKGRL